MSNVRQAKPGMAMLIPMPAERFAEFVNAASASHALDNIAIGRWSAQEAAALARAELERLLPQGHHTPDHYFYDIRADPQGVALGFVWFADLLRGSKRVIYLFQLLVYPEHRRRGHARSALAAIEALARERGVATVALNVFGGNLGAQELYRSVGYVVTSMSMQRELPPDHGA
jgi:ribosomal protein S18 acetylase RimI-like enzyme